MSPYTGSGRDTRPPCPRRARAAAVVTVAAAAAFVAAGCGSPSPAQAGGAPTAGGAARNASWLAYAQCVRSHGVPGFPDPNASEQLPAGAAKHALREVSDSVAKAATYACAKLNPAESGPHALTAQQEQDYLKAAACMRSHGITNFPDPTFSGGSVGRIPASIDTSSPQFIRARQICERLIPAGLRSSGG